LTAKIIQGNGLDVVVSASPLRASIISSVYEMRRSDPGRNFPSRVRAAWLSVVMFFDVVVVMVMRLVQGCKCGALIGK
jgi:hypothetical protein